ncbi:MAG: hypothetical protein C0481_14525 [Phenylobacterium sp.]|uniref:hypothetical protein n=1 Tax=Phenylobacterium sp. TaxID=1871053 RepID=UPI0025EB3003|nr:hypothetical protein [Phenylobacterium sp.]MBA4013078.1 hypothetical protein [Phenylobacterium sp.]
MIDRRTLLTAAALLAAAPLPALASAPRTRWKLAASEGMDAIAFLGPLSGKPFYARFYESEIAAFKPRLAPEALDALAVLHARADAAGSLLWPGLALIFSGGPTTSVDDLLHSLANAETVLRPPLAAGEYWDAEDWDRFIASRDQLAVVLGAMRDADFAGFRRGLAQAQFESRTRELQTLLGGLDVIAEQERLLGRKLDPLIEIELCWFCKPHGVKVQGQRFLTFVGARDQIVVLTAAHEILHPPIDMKGPAATAALGVLGQDALFTKILAEKDRQTGYNSLDGILNEDTAQALDQIIQERLGYVVRPAAERWTQGDQGMHVLAAGLYGLLKADGYDRTGGNLEAWMLAAARGGKLAPASLHAAAGKVLGKPADGLWTTPAKA